MARRSIKNVVVSREQQVYLHGHLWHASKCVLDIGLENEEGSSWQFLSSIILTAFALEALLNHLGRSLLSNWDVKERKLTVEAKLKLLCNTLDNAFASDFGARPLSTIKELYRFRNDVAHGKPVVLKPNTTRVSAEDADIAMRKRILAGWEKKIETSDFALRVREDVSIVAEKLHGKVRHLREPVFSMGFGSGSAHLVERS